MDCYLNLILDGRVLRPRENIPPEFPSYFPGLGKFRSDLLTLTKRFSPLFEDISKAPDREQVIKHLVDTGNAQPVYQPVRQLSPALLGELKTRLPDLSGPQLLPGPPPFCLQRTPTGEKFVCVWIIEHLMR
jgi:hypothetical protein